MKEGTFNPALSVPDWEVIFGEPWSRGDGRCDKIVVSGVKEHDRGTHLSTRSLMKLRP
jgi:hypothetical protein